jgi:hypothetical protein
MYFIQGADQKEYGPITAEQLRQWIAENRLNRTSLARAESDPAWKPLSDFPEFADAFGVAPVSGTSLSTPYGTVTPVPTADAVASLVRPPSIAVIVAGGLGALLAVWGIVSGLLGIGQGQQLPPGMPAQYEQFLKSYMAFVEKFGVFMNLGILITSVVTILAGVRMMQLRSYGLVLTGIILGMIPCLSGCCCLGLPFGIWALIILNKPEVKSSFR